MDSMPRHLHHALVVALPAIALSSAATLGGDPSNILFVILDDVGADQFHLTNPTGVDLPRVPTLDALADRGVNFTNAWAMPECSPSRVSLFTGRFPGRTRVGTPMTPPTLAQSQCSPFEATTPRLLEEAGYSFALFGKFHLAQSDNNPFDLLAPTSVGFRHFDGTLLGGPPFIDPTCAGQLCRDDDCIEDLYSCGFPVDGSQPAICACAFEDGPCFEGVDALECLAAGGVPLVSPDGTPIRTCDPDAIDRIVWSNKNGNYVWPRTVNLAGQAKQTIARVHADVDQAELAIAFINERQAAGDSWMCVLSFTGDHDPWQPPTPANLPPGTIWPEDLPLACGDQQDVSDPGPQQRILSNWTIESMDIQLRRVLLLTGLAEETPKGELLFKDPNTVIVVLGDNGSYLTTVRLPFNPTRAKATAYETGVRVPLIVSGDLIASPGRGVDHMVNIVDLFELFGELAGIDVHAAVPEGRVLDSESMLPYLLEPKSPSARAFNFSQYFEAELSETCYPCLISAADIDACTDTILTSESLCADMGGVWYGPTASNPEPIYLDCCDLYVGLGYADGSNPNQFDLIAAAQTAVTDGRYKVVFSDLPPCITESGTNEYEFYDLSQCFAADVLFGRGIDNPSFDLLASGRPLTSEQEAAYASLRATMDALLTEMTPCLGDLTLDGEVNQADLAALLEFWGGPSVGDLNNDAETNALDLAMLVAAWGPCGG